MRASAPRLYYECLVAFCQADACFQCHSCVDSSFPLLAGKAIDVLQLSRFARKLGVLEHEVLRGKTNSWSSGSLEMFQASYGRRF
ncbi:hypothetical protein ACHAPZ_003454 [Fusarium culmorum]